MTNKAWARLESDIMSVLHRNGYVSEYMMATEITIELKAEQQPIVKITAIPNPVTPEAKKWWQIFK